MNFKKYIKFTALVAGLAIGTSACDTYLDVNQDPNNVLDAPIEQVLTSATVSLGFWGGSDMHRYTALITQQFAGQGQGATTQNQEYERYNIQGSDLNNLWALSYATILSDLELVKQKAVTENSPHYGGVAKIMQAYVYQVLVDAFGNIPYSDALKFADGTNPKFDNGDAVYASLIQLVDSGISDINAAASVKSPGTNSTIFSGSFATSKPRWERFANTLKLRLLLHQTKGSSKADAVSKINALVASGASFMASTADNFQMPFVNSPRNQNPIHQFELDRVGQFFPNATLVDMMNTKNDPRRPRYFTDMPLYSGTYKGAKAGDAPSIAYSRMHIYLRGDTTAAGAAATRIYPYTGTAPVRMLTYPEYCFMRAEAALYGVTGAVTADSFFRAGILASMSQAGVSTANANAYVLANGSILTGTDEQKLQRIIEEKYVANYGVVMEPWTDYRRTGYPALALPPNPIGTAVPRSFFYPQSEIDLNPNAPAQKANLAEKIFWDK